MPKLTRQPPKYSLHKPSGQARVRYLGRDHYLGPYGSRESREAYARLIAEFSRDDPAPFSAPGGLTVAELILKFWGHCQVYYRHPDGTPTGEAAVIKCALRPLRRLFGTEPAAGFGARKLKLLRDEMIRLGWTRRYVNDQVGRVRRMFTWAASEELVLESVAGSLATVKGLEAGRSAAREKPAVKAVADGDVEATLPHLPPVVADVVRLLRLSGARVGELLAMTADGIDRSDPECWSCRPARHKTAHRGKVRVIHFGPRAVEILSPYVARAGGGRLLGYTRDGVRQAVARACAKAGVPHWHPHMLRHAAGTAVRERFGLEGSQAVLGHARAETSEIYSTLSADRAREIARQVG
jgi:integrase